MENKSKINIQHILALVSIGAMAYIFADIIHEAIGHGITSLIVGNKIILLTSVFFRSERHSFITDALGPILNLVAGLLIWGVIRQVNLQNLYIRLLVVFTTAFNFFWFSWMCLYCGITNKGDFAFYFPTQTTLLIWRIALVVIGFISYYFTFQATSKQIKRQYIPAAVNLRQLFLIPYFSSGIAAIIAVSFYKPIRFENFYEAFMFPMFLPSLFLLRQAGNTNQSDRKYILAQQTPIIFSGLILFILFCLTIGHGIKP